MAAESSDNFLRGALQQIEALTDIVELVILDEQVMHAAHRCRDESDAVVARVDVHEIGLQRRDHEVADAKAEQVLVEGQGSVDVWDGQKGVSHTLRAGAETGNVAAGLEGGVGDVGAMEDFQAVAGRVSEGDQVRHTTLVISTGGVASSTSLPPQPHST